MSFKAGVSANVRAHWAWQHFVVGAAAVAGGALKFAAAAWGCLLGGVTGQHSAGKNACRGCPHRHRGGPTPPRETRPPQRELQALPQRRAEAPWRAAVACRPALPKHHLSRRGSVFFVMLLYRSLSLLSPSLFLSFLSSSSPIILLSPLLSYLTLPACRVEQSRDSCSLSPFKVV